MEELEYDDGIHEFGSISRGSGDVSRRKSEGGIEWLDWGEHGALLHLPLTSLLYPILSIPNTFSRLFTPSVNFLNHYTNSFTDGTQLRGLDKFRSEVEGGGAMKMLSKVQGHWEKKVREKREELEAQRSKMKSGNSAAARTVPGASASATTAGGNGGRVKGVKKDVEGKEE